MTWTLLVCPFLMSKMGCDLRERLEDVHVGCWSCLCLNCLRIRGAGWEERERERGGHQLIVPGLLLTMSAPANSLTHTDGHILYIISTALHRKGGRKAEKYQNIISCHTWRQAMELFIIEHHLSFQLIRQFTIFTSVKFDDLKQKIKFIKNYFWRVYFFYEPFFGLLLLNWNDKSNIEYANAR